MKSAIVIGAGASGASAAFRLTQAGVKVQLIEREDRVGGRMRTERINGFIVDVGAGLLPGTYKAVHRLMHDAGLSNLMEALRSPTAIPRNGRLHYLALNHALANLAATRLISARTKLRLLRIPFHAASMWSTLGFDNLGLAAPFDRESVASYAIRELGDEALQYLIGPIVKTMYSVSPSKASVIDFFWCVRNLLSSDAFCVVGGMDRMVAGVAQQLDVKLSTQVIDVRPIEDKVRVTLRAADGLESAQIVDFCVIATRSCDVPAIHPSLDPQARSYLAALEYTATTDLHLRLNARPEEKAAVIMVPDPIDADICTMLFQHNKGNDRVPAGKGAVSVYFHNSWAANMSGLSDAEVFEKGMGKIERVLPGLGKLVEGYHVQRWDFTATKSYPGYYKELARFTKRLDLDSRIQLAGDYFAMACVNTAVTSGESAAARLIAKYL